jgi:hypothetical protein
MFWFLVLLGIVAWLLLRKPKPTVTQVAAGERDARLANESLAEYSHRVDRHTSQRFDFRTMTVLEEGCPLDPGPAKYIDYNVRRVDAVTWEVRQTPESVAQQLAALQADPEAEEADVADLKEFAGRWGRLDGGLASVLESRYQRYLLHFREG